MASVQRSHSVPVRRRRYNAKRVNVILASVVWCVTIIVLVWLFSVILPSPTRAHDHWVNRGNYKNAAGEYCCGAYDCKDGLSYRSTSVGWLIETGEVAPYDEGVLDANGKAVVPPTQGLTICRRPDGTRRCVFGPKPGF